MSNTRCTGITLYTAPKKQSVKKVHEKLNYVEYRALGDMIEGNTDYLEVYFLLRRKYPGVADDIIKIINAAKSSVV